MEGKRGARGKLRSARRIALIDQLYAELEHSKTYLATYEFRERFAGIYHSDLFIALERLHQEGRIDKIKHPLLKHVFWGFPGKKYGPLLGFAHLTERIDRMRAALEGAPPPVGPCDSWAEEYEDWWNGQRRDAL